MILKLNFKYSNLRRGKRGLCQLCNKRKTQNVYIVTGCMLKNVKDFSPFVMNQPFSPTTSLTASVFFADNVFLRGFVILLHMKNLLQSIHF
jgi:hypothetical protein